MSFDSERMTADFKQIDSTIDVVTPENIAFQYEVAGPFRRIPAFAIDVCIRVAVWVLLLIVFSILGFVGGPGGGMIGIALWLLIWFVMEWFYGGLLETYWNGQTVGKRMMGIRVLRTDGQPINGLQAVMRNILRLVDMMPVIPFTAFFGTEAPWALPTCMFGIVTPMLNQRFQRLGDLVCGTMVVVEEKSWLLSAAKLEDPRTPELAAYLPANYQVSRKLARALASYAERRRFLSKERRQEIARHLGEPLVSRFGLPPDTSHDLLLCALYHRTFVARPIDDARPSDMIDENVFLASPASQKLVVPQSPLGST